MTGSGARPRGSVLPSPAARRHALDRGEELVGIDRLGEMAREARLRVLPDVGIGPVPREGDRTRRPDGEPAEEHATGTVGETDVAHEDVEPRGRLVDRARDRVGDLN